MKLKASLNFGLGLIALIIMLSCSGSEYKEQVKREMARGVIHDSLLFGLKFGDPKQKFFKTCWDLNQKGIVNNGPGNSSVKYKLPLKSDVHPEKAITLLFFADFNDYNIITGMDMEFYYDAWSLWNRSLQSDKLLPVVMDSLMKWYPGNNFFKVPANNDSLMFFAKIDGNRRIVIKPIDHENRIKVKIDDLRNVIVKK